MGILIFQPASHSQKTGSLSAAGNRITDHLDLLTMLVRKEESGRLIVRDTAWAALMLLFRGRPQDIQTAVGMLNAVLDSQFDCPNTVYHGTFRRFPDDPIPLSRPSIWKDYDPNWRS